MTREELKFKQEVGDYLTKVYAEYLLMNPDNICYQSKVRDLAYITGQYLAHDEDLLLKVCEMCLNSIQTMNSNIEEI